MMQTPYQYVPLHLAEDGNENGVTLPITGGPDGSGRALGVQIVGSFTGTVNFEATIDGTTWVAFLGRPGGSTDVTDEANTASAAGIWQFNVGGLRAFRARLSSMSGGTVSVHALLDMKD